MPLKFRKSLFVGCAALGALVSQPVFAGGNVPPPSTGIISHYYVSLGLGRPIVMGRDTKGDLETTGQSSLDDYSVNGSNLSYNGGVSPSVELGMRLSDYFRVGVNYSHMSSDLDTKKELVATGTDAREVGHVSAHLNADVLLLKGYADWYRAFNMGSVAFTPFAGVGVGASRLDVSQTHVFTTDLGGYTLARNYHWRFAWTVEVGMQNHFSHHFNVDYGVRYDDYGKYSTSERITSRTQDATVQDSLEARLYSIEPFVNFTYSF